MNYLPQNFFEDLCSEIARGEEGKFQGELESVVYSKLPEADRLGFSTLRDLLEYKSGPIKDASATLRGDLSRVNTAIANLERMNRPEYRLEVENRLNQSQRKLKDLEDAKPDEVKAPSQEEGREATPDEKALEESRIALSRLDVEISDAEASQKTIAKKLAALERID